MRWGQELGHPVEARSRDAASLHQKEPSEVVWALGPGTSNWEETPRGVPEDDPENAGRITYLSRLRNTLESPSRS